jgi:penicillin-binding protein 2
LTRFSPFLIALLLLALTACRPASASQPIVIPTLVRLPSAYPLENAERVAREFLQNWQDGQYDWMYDLLTFASRESYTREQFSDQYRRTAEALALTDLAIQPTGIYRQQDEIAIFTYELTLQTAFGTFNEGERALQLVVDDLGGNDRDWRIAWTPGAIFPELAGGGSIRVTRVPPNRANIYDRDGDVLGDQNGRLVAINVVRASVPAYPECLTALARALDQPAEAIQARWEARPVSERVEVGTIDAVRYTETHADLEALCRAEFDARSARRYPDGTVMPHILGYVGFPTEEQIEALRAAGFSSDSIIGRAGIEATWDETLRGVPSLRVQLVGPAGQVLRELASVPGRAGQSLWLTLDAAFQARVQRIVADAFTVAKDTWARTSGGASVVVMDVHTGAIYALVSYPTFDNNAYTAYPLMGRQEAARMIAEFQADPLRPEVNRPVQGVFTLGSVMKTIAAAAAADSGVYALDQRYTCTGVWNRDITRYDWLPGGHGTLTLPGSLTQSCNPYYYEVGYNLYMADPWILPNYARRLGFGVPTGMTDLVDAAGFMPDPEWFRTTFGTEMPFSEEVNMAIGQGYVQVTPLQVTRWFAAIANGGDLPRPYLVERTGLIGGELTTVAQVHLTPTGLRPEVIDMLHDGLCAVTTESYGTAEFVFRNSPLQALGVCGKTGTAQTGGPETPSHAWFAAYAPRVNPEIAVVALVETAGQGSEIAAPIVRQVMEAYFNLGN